MKKLTSRTDVGEDVQVVTTSRIFCSMFHNVKSGRLGGRGGDVFGRGERLGGRDRRLESAGETVGRGDGRLGGRSEGLALVEKEEDLEVEKKDLKGVVEDLLGRLKHWAGEAEVLEGEVKGSVEVYPREILVDVSKNPHFKALAHPFPQEVTPILISKQCAAVRTHSGSTRDPPQNCFPLSDSNAQIMAACQGDALGLATIPPTIRVSLCPSRREGEPRREVDIAIITETWLKSDDSTARIAATPPGYLLSDHPRPDRNGGGTGILARDSLVVKQARAGICDTFEYSEWIIVSGTARLRLVVIYRPPYSSSHPRTVGMFVTEFAEFLESVVMTTEPLVLAGDLTSMLISRLTMMRLTFKTYCHRWAYISILTFLLISLGTVWIC
ncbi:hypothetical protein AWC38_SpisGene1612 [Stylophora pistillata]|uniref:Endonuclease/exonuclease/phosphatase domain-containing protein n=1 Tax=Stylophora pistillata TaxID=50429 RepID=A0A2B4SYM6_STYPI|nr:hypothetical protein AWC38_SpisGene1612 [Stylophora pistillata]